MVPCEETAWQRILRRVEETEADGVEVNFGCPHGMSERGMGSAVGQVPEYIEMVTRWVKAATRMPVIVKLTPNVTDVRYATRASRAGGADAVSLINTLNSITSVNLDTFSPEPSIDGKGSHGGYAGPAAKPIGLHMVAEIARDPETRGLPVSGIGGISTWRDAAEYIALGWGTVQVCTAAMVYGFRIVEEMISGLQLWMADKGYARLSDFQGRAVRNVTDWQYLNLNYTAKARIDQEVCIKCGRCLCGVRGHVPPVDRDPRRARLRGDRRGVRRLQPLRHHLPRGELHHDGVAAGRGGGHAHRQGRRALRELDDAPEQPERGGGRGRLTLTPVALAKDAAGHCLAVSQVCQAARQGLRLDEVDKSISVTVLSD